MASALLRMGRIRGVSRPAIAAPLPVPGETPTVLLDAGANAECQPEWLVQFAQMGTVFSRQRFGIAKPRVGLLSIGEEASKGSSFVKEVHHLLEGAPGVHFIGNIEGRDLVATDAVDVVVTDGFSGNVVLKTLEGGLEVILGVIRAGLASTAEHARRGRRAGAGPRAALRLHGTRDDRGRDAPRRRRRLHHQPRVARRLARSPTRSGSRGEMVVGDIVGGLRSAIATPG